MSPMNRSTIVRCIDPGACEGSSSASHFPMKPTLLNASRYISLGILITASPTASLDVVCGSGSCNGLNIDCRGSNFSCNLACEDSMTKTGQVYCNPAESCNCHNSCGSKYNCTSGINCPGDPCFMRFGYDEACYPNRLQASVLTPSYDGGSDSCDCHCTDPSLQGSDFVGHYFQEVVRYCVPPGSVCSNSSVCGHGACYNGGCQCFNGWQGDRCDSGMQGDRERSPASR